MTNAVLYARADTGLTVRARAICIYCARPRAATPWVIPSRRRPADKERLANLDTLQTDIDFIIAEYRHS